jgi:hypothetical protein
MWLLMIIVASLNSNNKSRFAEGAKEFSIQAFMAKELYSKVVLEVS